MLEPCKSCGKPLDLEDDTFCPHCGIMLNASDSMWEEATRVTLDKEPEGTRDAVPQDLNAPGMLAFEEDIEPDEKSAYAMVSVVQYLGFLLVLLIPAVGLIFSMIWGGDGEKRVNVKNLAAAAARFQLYVYGTVLFFWMLYFGLMQWSKFRGIL